MKEMYNFNYISKKRNIILGIATLLVAYCHSTSLLVENLFSIQIINNILVFIREIGTIGVDIFLILSGVGLYYSFSKNKNLKQFYKKRAVRILPAAIIVAIIITMLKGGYGVGKYLQRIFLLQFFIDGNLDFWYFSFIIVLYFLYPLLHKMVEKYDYKFVIIFIISIVLGNVLLMKYNIYLYNRFEIATTRIPVFIMGIWIGKKSYEEWKINAKWLLLFLAMFLIIILLLYSRMFISKYIVVRFLYCPLAVSIVVILSCVYTIFEKNSLLTRFFIWLGTYSMEIYLLYEYLVKNYYYLFNYKDPYNISYYICMFVVTLILATVLRRFCDELTDRVIVRDKS